MGCMILQMGQRLPAGGSVNNYRQWAATEPLMFRQWAAGRMPAMVRLQYVWMSLPETASVLEVVRRSAGKILIASGPP